MYRTTNWRLCLSEYSPLTTYHNMNNTVKIHRLLLLDWWLINFSIILADPISAMDLYICVHHCHQPRCHRLHRLPRMLFCASQSAIRGSQDPVSSPRSMIQRHIGWEFPAPSSNGRTKMGASCFHDVVRPSRTLCLCFDSPASICFSPLQLSSTLLPPTIVLPSTLLFRSMLSGLRSLLSYLSGRERMATAIPF